MSADKKNTDKLLVAQLREGNEKAFKKLFGIYRNPLFAYAKSLVQVDSYAEEIVQDVFLKVWLNRANLKAELSFKSYLYTITKNHTFNFLAKAVTDKKLREEVFYAKSTVEYLPVDDYIEGREYEVIRKKAIQTLPPRRKLIFEMSRDEGKSYQDIGSELGISTQTVKNQMSQALSNITMYLETKGEITFLLLVFFNIL